MTRSLQTLCRGWLILLAACSRRPELPPEAAAVLPHDAHLAEGVTNAYLVTYDRGSNYEVQGQLEYMHICWAGGDTLVTTVMTPDLRPTDVDRSLVDADGLRLLSSLLFRRGDTSNRKIEEDRLLRFGTADTARSVSSAMGNRFERILIRGTDTTWHALDARSYRGLALYTDSASVRTDTSRLLRLYVAGLGQVYSAYTTPEYVYSRELLYQLSPKQVDSLRATIPQRVAYIDPDSTLIPDRDGWAPCHDIDDIADYYNPSKDIRYPGRQYGLRKDLLPHVDLAAFAGENGYLTVRFVINCRGETGRFTTDESDLDFRPKRFPPAAVLDLARAIQRLEGWSTAPLRDTETDNADYYTYLTLKFEDGQLVDLLP